jgi:hypothetical protein
MLCNHPLKQMFCNHQVKQMLCNHPLKQMFCNHQVKQMLCNHQVRNVTKYIHIAMSKLALCNNVEGQTVKSSNRGNLQNRGNLPNHGVEFVSRNILGRTPCTRSSCEFRFRCKKYIN